MWDLFYLKSAMMLDAYACYILPFLASKVPLNAELVLETFGCIVGRRKSISSPRMCVLTHPCSLDLAQWTLC
jgi:hypothetical protein